MFDTPHTFLRLDHAHLATWTVGEGPDLVFVHGWPFWSATYRGLLPHLSTRFRCHLIDLPGAGKTLTHDRSAIDLRRHVDTLGGAVDALGLDRYALLAFDSGGMVTRALAARRPEQVSALVLGNTEMPGHVSPLFARFLRVAATRVGRLALIAALRVRPLRRGAWGFGTCLLDPARFDAELERLYVGPMLASKAVRDDQFALVEAMDPSFMAEMADVHAALRCPAQLIWGDRDPWFKLSGARACLPQFGGGAELEVLPGKLMVHEEEPQRFAAIAADFLERVVVRAAA
ncbi:MAG: alpha/beta hydrolase [Myxococcota bacterium]